MDNTQPFITDEAVTQRAYFLWEQAGRPSGRDAEFWHRAQDELKVEASTPAAVKRSVVPPPPVPASPPHEVPPVMRAAVKVPSRRAAQPRRNKPTASA